MTKLSQAEVAKYILRLRDSQDNFLGFVKLHYPEWTLADFQLELIDTLDKLEKNTLGTNNLLITMPPRHAKSTFGTVLFPSYFMAKNPDRFIMSCSYNTQLSTDFGRQIRGIVEQQIMRQAFPMFNLSKDSRAADVWRTEDGGAYFAVGIGGTTSGRPANLLVVDDPIKSREEAESILQTLADEVSQWSGIIPEFAIREGRKIEQLLSVLEGGAASSPVPLSTVSSAHPFFRDISRNRDF